MQTITYKPHGLALCAFEAHYSRHDFSFATISIHRKLWVPHDVRKLLAEVVITKKGAHHKIV